MPTDQFVTAQDGLRLHLASYGTPGSLPVLCLPGLARTGADFDALGTALSGKRQVLAMDYRGRGQSDYDRDPRNYNLAVELSDVLTVLTALDIGRVAIVGTSRGGILAMLLGATRPAAVAAIVLNDIGPVIEPRGLARIKSYVGKLPEPKSVEDGAEILRRLFADQFPRLTLADWMAFARRTFQERDGRFVPTYDVRLAHALDGLDLTQPLPTLWREFGALAAIPLMIVRGAKSDVLSAETVAEMRARRPDIVSIEVPDQGHAPLLSEPQIIERIMAFIAACDRQVGPEGLDGRSR